jgi:hypothetical protein
MTFKDEEIAEEIERSRRLPPTHRQGFPGKRDDLADGGSGEPVFVPTPETPDDQWGA